MRGLKLVLFGLCCGGSTVAPYVGAWIETYSTHCGNCHFRVAPYVGAWIETSYACYGCILFIVAPYVGAWIETKKQ